MKVLSLTQPWSTLVVLGAKQFETRSWSTQYRGALLIHASKNFPKDCRELTFEAPFNAALQFKDWSTLPLGAIIGRVELVDCLPTEKITRLPYDEVGLHEIEFGNFAPGRFAWKLENPTLFVKPIPAKGSLGLWEYNWPVSGA